MIQYVWCVRGLTTELSYDGLEDFVNAAQWQLTATDDVTLHSAWTSDTWQTFTPDPAQPYVPRSELTDDLVMGWIQTALGPEQVSAIEAETASRIPPAEPTE
jgi:hypothetical protein